MSDPIRDYLRPFKNAFETGEQIAHLHALIHDALTNQTRITTTMEAHMSAIQDQLNTLANEIDKATSDLTSELQAVKDANPNVDLSGIQSAVDKLSALDAANAVPAASEPTSAPATSDAPAAGDAAAAPASDTSAPTADATSTDAAPTDGATTDTNVDNTAAASSDETPAADTTTPATPNADYTARDNATM